MRKDRCRMVIAAFSLFLTMLSTGCGGPANTNISQVQNSTPVTTGTPTPTPPKPRDPCPEPVSQAKADLINESLNYDIEHKNKLADLKKQKADNFFRYNAVANIVPAPGNSAIYLYIGGELTDWGDNAAPKELLKDLADFIKPYRKRGCVEKVILVPRDSETLDSVGARSANGFELFGCESGYYPCPGGVCSPNVNCSRKVNENTNSNRSPTSNTNTSSNSNSNSGRLRP